MPIKIKPITRYIQLSHDRCEDDYGFHTASETTSILGVKSKLETLPWNTKPDPTRSLQITTWGLKLHQEPMTHVTFDLSKFRTPTFDKKAVRSMTGLNTEIQEGILRHSRYLELLETIVEDIENQELTTVSLACNYGKHRSVGWAEILRKYCYPKAEIQHLGLSDQNRIDCHSHHR
jgi:RNase adaptor protein for sRNA GlmZ degradation